MLKVNLNNVFLLSAFVLFVAGTLTVAALTIEEPSPVWEGDVFSSGVEVTTSVALLSGKQYRIVANGTWWYDWPGNLAVDAQYYTTDFVNSVFWGDHFLPLGGGSFLQINRQNVSWGEFSNGDTGHTYTTYYAGNGSAITFRIVDWMDGNYGNNVCHIHLRIFKEVTVGGRIADPDLGDAAAYVGFGALVLACAVIVPVTVHYRRKTRG